MNENIDLTKILKNCPVGTEFYHLIYDKVYFFGIDLKDIDYPIHLSNCKDYMTNITLTENGKHLAGFDGECILFPSKDQRDWSKFERFWDKPNVERFDPKTLQPFDKVLAKGGFSSKWTCSFFSHMDNDVSFPVYCSGGYLKVCIPYNEETKHLVGKIDDCPEYYKWWEK